MRIAAVLVCCLNVTAAADVGKVSSSDGRVQLHLLLEDNGALGYFVSFKSTRVIETSPLAMIVDGVNLADGVQAGKADRYRVNETYPWIGVHSTAVNRAGGLRVNLTHRRTGTRYMLEARAYNDGVAFRFIVPGAQGNRRVPDEATVFRLPAGSTLWYHDFEGHYEGVPARKAIGEVKAGDWAAPPLTFKLPDNSGYGAITEGALIRYSGMGLQGDGRGGFAVRLGHAHPASYPFRLRYKDDVERMSKPAAIAGPVTTPWRIVMVGSDLNALVNSDIVHNVAPPPDPKVFVKAEWIKPGRAVWKYLDGGENTLAGMREFSRLAGELGFEYNVIEGFWQQWSEQELKELVDYSRSLGVGIILWKHSRDIRDPVKRRAFFELCQRNGVSGAKIDFFDHEHKDVVELYEACLRDAAEFKQVIDFHGANKPTGESRAWPNELTREAIKGMEGRRVVRAPLDATLPFTRMLAGHADYTPMVFGERRNDTTWAHQIASAAIYTSPLLVYGGHPRSILDNPAAEVIRKIPSAWDETIVLPLSEIGEIAAFARRRGDEWFVAIMNGPAPRTVNLPLSFLGPGQYGAVVVLDSDKGADAVEVERRTFSRADSVRVPLRSGGGFIARYSKAASEDRRRQSALDSLIAAERSFSRASVDRGIRAAFLEYLDEPSVVFRPRPVDGRKAYSADENSKITLSWTPVFAEVSAAGDLGYTTGPWTISEDQAGLKPVRYGHYMTVWRRKNNGSWRVAIDLGTTHPEPGKTSAYVESPRAGQAPRPASQAAERSALLDADRAFSAASQAAGFAKAFLDFSAPGVRLYRRSHLPFTTASEVRAALHSNRDAISWSPAGAEVSASGDLGYTYGIVRPAGGKSETAAYCRVWRKQAGDGWKVVIDVENPFPPGP